MLVIDPPAAPSCTVQFTPVLLAPLTVAMNDCVAPWFRFAAGGEIEIPSGIGIAMGVPPPPPQPVTTTGSMSRTRDPILVFMEPPGLPTASGHKSRNASLGSAVRTERIRRTWSRPRAEGHVPR